MTSSKHLASRQGPTETDWASGGRVVARAVVFLVCVTLSLIAVGILLGAAGLFSAWVASPLALLLGLLLFRLWSPRTPASTAAGTSGMWLVAVAISLAATAVNLGFPSERYIGGRDAATYLATGASLAADGSLFVDAREGAFERAAGLEFGGPGFFDSRADGRLRPQFLHGLPVLLATGHELGGDWLMVRVNIALGGLALLVVFGFARLLVGGWLALLVQITLGVNLVFVYFARAPFSEILAVVFIFSGLWALWDAFEARSARTAVVAGLLLGGTLVARLDGLVLLIPLVAYLAYAQRKARGSTPQTAVVRGVWRGLLPMIVLAFFDLVVVTPDYLANHDRVVVPILVIVAIIVVGDGLLGSQISRLAQRLPRRDRNRIAWLGGGALLVLLLIAYFVRPLVQEVSGSPYLRLVMDPAELEAGERRLFSENSALWLGWYLGPVTVLAGFIGWAWLTKRVLEGRDRRALPFLLLFSSMAVLYLWRPSINPDHIWAMRRFLPLVIPGLLVSAAYLLRELWGWSTRWNRRALRRVGVGTLGAVLLGGSLLVSAPLFGLHEFKGLGADLRAGCDMMGDDAAVLLVDSPGSAIGSRLAATYRAHCGLPSAYVSGIGRSQLKELQTDWELEGRRLWLLGVDREVLAGLGSGSVEGVLVGSYDILELTFTRRPSELADFEVGLFAVHAPGE